MPASYEIERPVGFGVSVVRYSGIDTVGIRDTVTETTLSENVIEVRRDPDAEERLVAVDTDHAGVRHRSLKTGQLVSSERFEAADQFQGPGGGLVGTGGEVPTEPPALQKRYRNLVYGGETSRTTGDSVQIAVWNVDREPDDPVPFDAIRSSWWDRAKGIAFAEIGPIADDVAVRGVEENEPIDEDEVREVSKPLGKVNGVVVIDKAAGGNYAYRVNFSEGRLERLGGAAPETQYIGGAPR